MHAPFTSYPNSPVHVEICPDIWLDSRLAVWFVRPRLLVIADPHWGYVASHRARGNLLPWWGDNEIESRMHALLTTYQPAEMIWLGDVVHAAEGGARAEAFVRQSPVPITLIAGNHDRRWRSAEPASVTRGNYFLHHGDKVAVVPAECMEVIGHHHPATSWWDGAGSRLKLPALVASSHRLILPAFSPWAAGTPWGSPTTAGETIWAISPNRIFALARNDSAQTGTGA